MNKKPLNVYNSESLWYQIYWSPNINVSLADEDNHPQEDLILFF